MGLKRLVRQGKLRLDEQWSQLAQADQLNQWCEELKRTDWNVYIEGPPHGQSHPQHVLKYLTRYLSGGPVHDARIISDDERQVTFWARSKNKLSGNLPRPFKLSGVEFVRRWAMHILPKGFTRVRRYGGYHPRQSAKYMELCRRLLQLRGETESPAELCQSLEAGVAATDSPTSQPHCPQCQVPLRCIGLQVRPSWKQIFEVDVYRHRDIYIPGLHLFVRGPCGFT